MYVFLIFVAVHETLWCNHCRHKTSLTAQYFCTVVAALHAVVFQHTKLYFKTSTISERKQGNGSKTTQIYTKQSEAVLKNNNNLLNKYKQAWIHTSFHRKSVRFLKNEIICFTKNKTFQVGIVPISFLNDSETQDFRELKSKKF